MQGRAESERKRAFAGLWNKMFHGQESGGFVVHVPSAVMLSAQPSYFQRFIVILVVHLRWSSANFAWLPLNLPAFQVNMGITAAVHLVALVGREWMLRSPRSDVGRVAILAIGAQFAGDYSTWLATGAKEKERRHGAVLHKQQFHVNTRNAPAFDLRHRSA